MNERARTEREKERMSSKMHKAVRKRLTEIQSTKEKHKEDYKVKDR